MRRTQQLQQLFRDKIVVLDGAMGTALQDMDLSADVFGGEDFEGCNEVLNLTRPDLVTAVLESYLQAGADIIQTNTFGSTDLVLAEYPPLEQQAYDITRAGAVIARQLADRYTTDDKPRFVAGSMGPTTKAISVTGGVTFDRLIDTFYGQARALVEGGVDYLLIETAQDTRNVKAAIIGIQRYFDEAGASVPIAVSGTIEPMGTMLAGQDAESLMVSLEHVDLLYIGLNCATGPDMMTDHLRVLAENAPWPVACVPNAGLPDEDGRYVETPAMMARAFERFIDMGWLNVIGGCCGTTPDHIEAFVDLAAVKAPRQIRPRRGTFVSGIETLEVSEDNRPVIVGERTNVIGSRLFKQLIVDEQFEEAAEIARRQVRSGAQVIDICLANPDRDELEDMKAFLAQAARMVKVPLMIDSTDPVVIEAALTYSQGKAIINSINLEDGEERFEEVVPTARQYGAALVVGTIDEDKEQSMAITRERKLEIAQRSYDLLTEKYGVPASDIIFDPLVFPCATGDKQYVGSAVETIEGIRLIKEALPECKTVLGISNVSFGLPAAGREVLNSVFLYHCTLAGLDMAIVNSEKLERYPSIPEEERVLAEQLLFEPTDATIAAFTAHFRGAKPRRTEEEVSTMSLDERLSAYVVMGSKDGLIADLEEKLKEATPLNIINGPLMAGMDEVGRLFGANELIVAEVLQSAEVMKTAVNHLEPLMEKDEATSKGRVILATVRGDVHDIGKNLVEIVLANNGFDVINLGIKVPPSDLIQAIREHRPDIVGLSGLLVKSAQQMVVTAEELTAAFDAEEAPPMLVGGAALTNGFTRRRIAPAYSNMVAYAKDAMIGLDLANQVVDKEKRDALIKQLAIQTESLGEVRPREPAFDPGTTRSPDVPILTEVPTPPDLSRRIIRGAQLDEIWRYINPAMLYSRHLGLRGGRAEKLIADGDEKAMQLVALIDTLKEQCRQGAMEVNAVWQFFKAVSEGNRLILLDPETGQDHAVFEFPRQPKRDGLCLADYVNPRGVDPIDSVCLFAVTAGRGIRALYQEYKDRGEYLKSHAIQALALETAEGTAEWLHAKIRGWWGFPDPPEMPMKDRFQARYRGRRYSFGYPACPDLGLQKQLFALIRPEDIGMELTEEYMMEPEASVSALVFHHPSCTYFGVGKDNL